MDKAKKEIFIINFVAIVVSAFPFFGLFIVPILFFYNLVNGISNYNKDRNFSILCFILAFVAPLIGFSVCSLGFSYMLSTNR